jgi:hypothetical protein
MKQSKLIREIRSKLIEAVDTEAIDWVYLAMVGEITNHQVKLTGFAYDGDGKQEPITLSNSEVHELLKDLRDTMASAENGPPWRSTLIRIERDSGEIGFEFRYDNPGRWTAVDPPNPRTAA